MSDNTQENVVTRFAPSPTGFLHIGGVRTALYAYLFAKKHNGSFILRIEDTDKAREVEGSIQHIQDSLSWLGIDWDYGPNKPGPFGSCLQSDRLLVYKKYAQKLIDKGLAYPDPYTAEELTNFRAQSQEEKRPFLFREHRPGTFAKWDGVTPLRFKVPTIKRYRWYDEVRGDLEAGEEMLDDFIIIKADGFPTYNFAHIVDDCEMNVTHVMRGEEFISSMPKFLSLLDALEITWPKFVTLPPIMGPDGKKKLSKRDGAKDLLDYKKDGYLPAAMCNFLALIGWNPGGDREIIPTSELIEIFSLDRIQRSGGAFNEEKLKWMNASYLAKLTAEEKFGYVVSALPEETLSYPQYSEDRLKKLLPTIFERIHNKVEIAEAGREGEYDWAFTTPEIPKELLKWKNDEKPEESLPRLKETYALLRAIDFLDPENIKSAVWSYAEKTGKGEVLWPLRVALTGKERSPDPFTCSYVLGKDETLKRIGKAIEILS